MPRRHSDISESKLSGLWLAQSSFNQEKSKRTIEPFPLKLKLKALAYSDLGPTRNRVRAEEV